MTIWCLTKYLLTHWLPKLFNDLWIVPGDFFRTIKDVCNRLSILSNWNFPTLLAFKMTVTVSSVSNLADLLQLIESNEPEQWQEIKNLIYEQYVRLVHKNVFFYLLFSSCQFLSAFEWIFCMEFCLQTLLISSMKIKSRL